MNPSLNSIMGSMSEDRNLGDIKGMWKEST